MCVYACACVRVRACFILVASAIVFMVLTSKPSRSLNPGPCTTYRVVGLSLGGVGRLRLTLEGFVAQGDNTEPQFVTQGDNTEPQFVTQGDNTEPQFVTQGDNTEPQFVAQGDHTEPQFVAQGDHTEPEFLRAILRQAEPELLDLKELIIRP